jgi:type IV secretory pathway TraG/TraD family ATPase VirD4
MSKPGAFMQLFEPRPSRKRSGHALLDFFTPPAHRQGRARSAVVPCAVRFDERYVYWAMRNMPITEAPKHFMILGAVGSGKTTAIELFLQSLAPRFRAGRSTPEHLIIFDAQRDILPTLASYGLGPDQENVWILNPFDDRCAVWNLADAAQRPAMARYIATMLVPQEEKSSAPFYASAARDLLTYVIWGLNRIQANRWALRDLLCAADSKERIEAVTARHPRAKRLAASILNDDKHAFGVLSTLTTKLSRFEEVAGLWHSRPLARQFSVPEFLNKPGVLVLGWDPVLNESLWPINAIVLQALADEILRGPRHRLPRHWFVFDEFRAMEKADAVLRLLNRGRSKGVSVLIALQSIEGLIDVYGPHKAQDILSACAHKTVLHLGDPKSAAWAEEYFGKIRRTERTFSENFGGKDGPTGSIQYKLEDRPALLASYFMSLPFTGPGRPFKAVSDVPWLDRTIITERWFDELNAWRPPRSETVSAFEPREDKEEETLKDWTKEEEKYYCVRPTSQRKKARRNASKTKPERHLPARASSPELPGLEAPDPHP